MNAGPGLELLIADWLVEESPGRAPDRILESAGRVIDETRQRRFVAEWREPMFVTLRGLLAAAAVLVVVVAVAVFAFRGSGPSAPQPTTSALPTATSLPSIGPAPATLADYRAARNAICADEQSRPIQDVPDWKADPTAAVEFLTEVIARGNGEISRLATLDVPPEIADEHAANLQAGRDTVAVIQHELALLQQGKVDEAIAVDAATGPLSANFQAFETKYDLQPCP